MTTVFYNRTCLYVLSLFVPFSCSVTLRRAFSSTESLNSGRSLIPHHVLLAMTESSRWVVVDDVDGRIKYSGNWELSGGEDYNERGSYGATYHNSLHGTATNSSRVWLTFKGALLALSK